jgi:hypothetical protein
VKDVWNKISNFLSPFSPLFLSLKRFFCPHDNIVYLKMYIEHVLKWKKSYEGSTMKYGKCKIKIRCMDCRKVMLLKKTVTVDVNSGEVIMVDSRTLKK